MPAKKNTATKQCRYGHDWRVSFDARFYYCYYCPAQWRGRPGETPPRTTYHTYPENPPWADHLPERNSTTMPSQLFNDLLDADDSDLPESKEAWMKVRDMLYEPIHVTRANIREEEDSYNPGRTRQVAYVHFTFLDDESETPFVFSSSAKAILSTVSRAVAGNEFPFDAAVIEILSAEPFNGYFPLRFTSLGKLAQAQAQLENSNQLVNHAGATSVPEAPSAPDVSATPKASTAATVGKRSAAGAANGERAQQAPRPPRSLATRGN